MAKGKSIEFSSLEIKAVVVNDIPRHKKGDFSNEPEYSEEKSKMSDGLRTFFKGKVTQALASSNAIYICFDNETTSIVPWQLGNMLREEGVNIVSQSKAISKYLYESQHGGNSSGILVTIFCKVNSQNACVLLKLERDIGARLTRDNETKTYLIEEVENLMLTEKTKIFKVVIFIIRKDFNGVYDGIMMDHQVRLASKKKEVTSWFLSRFLGCKAYEDPKISTQKFYNYTKAFVLSVEDKILQSKYIGDLNSYLQKNVQTISSQEFADDYLKTEHKNGYRDYLLSKKFTLSTIYKNNQHIKSQIQKMVVQFENGIVLIGKKGSIGENVKLTKMKSGSHKAEIISKIKKID